MRLYNQLMSVRWIVALLTVTNAVAEGAPFALDAEMTRLAVDTVYVLPGDAIDDQPIWSAEGHHLAVNHMGSWLSVDLNTVELGISVWMGRDIGMITNAATAEKLDAQQVASYEAATRTGPRELTTDAGLQITLSGSGLGTRLALMPPGGEPAEIWTTGMANCFGLSLSPDQRFVSYLCDTAGVFIMKLPQ